MGQARLTTSEASKPQPAIQHGSSIDPPQFDKYGPNPRSRLFNRKALYVEQQLIDYLSRLGIPVLDGCVSLAQFPHSSRHLRRRTGVCGVPR